MLSISPYHVVGSFRVVLSIVSTCQLVQQARGSRLCRAQKTFFSPHFPKAEVCFICRALALGKEEGTAL